MTQIEPIYSLRGKRVWVAGHRGMVGSALLRRLAQVDCTLLTVAREDLDLTQEFVSSRIGPHNSPSAMSPGG